MVLKKLLEYRIEVIRTDGVHATGVLVACDEQWIKLHKANGQVLCFPIVNVRNVRPVTPLE